jgi:hypothetical protein
MENNWIYKADGTIQCQAEPKAISLEDMAQELIKIFGEESIVQQKKLHIPTVKMCGVPTGAINAYELTPKDYYEWEHGIVGKLGFQELDPDLIPQTEDENDLTPALDAMNKPNPQGIGELPGHLMRTYNTGDPITMDYRPSRFNIETASFSDKTIVSVWFG